MLWGKYKKLKITDLSIVFSIVAMCFVVIINFKGNIMYESIRINSRYNVIMDNAVEDALRAGYENVNLLGKPVVNKENAVTFLFKEISIMINGTLKLEDYYSDLIKVLIYTEEDGFYFYDRTNGWSNKCFYLKKEETLHQDKVNQILEFIEDNYNIIMSIPINDGESYENTIDNYSLLLVYRGYDYFIDDTNYNSYCFSAAKVKSTE